MSDRIDTGTTSRESTLTEDEILSLRWDTLTFKIQGSPYESLTVSALAKNTGVSGWTRPVKGKADLASEFSTKSYDELCLMRGMDLKHVRLLIEIFEQALKFEDEVSEMGSIGAINELASTQRMRFVEQFGLHHDFPIALTNFDSETRSLCEAEGVITLVDLMDFIDRLSDRSTLGGTLRHLQSIFAHGDELGLVKYFPFRKGHRGFHLPEALSYCVKRLSPGDQSQVVEYYHSLKRRRVFAGKKQVPEALVRNLLPEIMSCLLYFGRRQPRLISRLDDAAYICRELMFLEDPDLENLVQWCLHLVLGVTKRDYFEADEELADMETHRFDTQLVKDVQAMFETKEV